MCARWEYVQNYFQVLQRETIIVFEYYVREHAEWIKGDALTIVILVFSGWCYFHKERLANGTLNPPSQPLVWRLNGNERINVSLTQIKANLNPFYCFQSCFVCLFVFCLFLVVCLFVFCAILGPSRKALYIQIIIIIALTQQPKTLKKLLMCKK